MKTQAIVFDLDNTLVSRDASLQVFVSEFLAGFSEDLREVAEETVLEGLRADAGGYGAKDEVFRSLREDLPWFHRPEESDVQDFWLTTFPKCTQASERVYEVQDRLVELGFRLGIVTNGSERSQNAKVDRLDFGAYMEAVVVSETAGVRKPDARIFGPALDEIGVVAGDAWFVGDHPVNDVLGAVHAGMTPVWISGYHAWPEGETPLAVQIERVNQLPALLEGT